jgi:MarR family transcriptional regulator, 2-MHQ and catechol-resistance regulon repressor
MASNDNAAAFYTALRRIVRRARSRDGDAVCSYGITVRECHALELLSERPLSVNGLARPLGLDKSTVSRLVQHLVSEKLVSRKVDQRDSRTAVLVLTAKGRKLYEAALADSLDVYRQLLERVTPAQRAAIVEALGLTADLLETRD